MRGQPEFRPLLFIDNPNTTPSAPPTATQTGILCNATPSAAPTPIPIATPTPMYLFIAPPTPGRFDLKLASTGVLFTIGQVADCRRKHRSLRGFERYGLLTSAMPPQPLDMV